MVGHEVAEVMSLLPLKKALHSFLSMRIKIKKTFEVWQVFACVFMEWMIVVKGDIAIFVQGGQQVKNWQAKVLDTSLNKIYCARGRA